MTTLIQSAQKFLLSTVVCFGLALADIAPAGANSPSRNEQRISFATGGIGQELSAMRQQEQQYNTRFSFANAADRAYLSDLHVRIRDAADKLIFEDKQVGPLLYLQLPSGQYALSAESNGVKKQTRFTSQETGIVRKSLLGGCAAYERSLKGAAVTINTRLVRLLYSY